MIHVFRCLLVVVCTIFWATPAVLLAVIDRSGRSVIWIARRWARTLLAGCGVRLEVEGLDQIDPASPCVLMSNHQSVVDVVALVAALPVDWRFVAKRELSWIPIFGWVLRLHRHILVDRRDHIRAVRSMERAVDRIRSGTWVLIFPEGTRSATGELRPFKSGGFHLALQAQVPILPATVSGSRQIAPRGSLRIQSGVVKVAFGRAISTRGLGAGDRNRLKERVIEAIRAGYDPALQPASRISNPPISDPDRGRA